MLFHIADAYEWQAAKAAGEYRISTLGRTLEEEGFIHCSASREQAAGVLDRYYRGYPDPLLLLSIDPSRVGSDVRVEGGFPHIYGPLPVASVVSAEPISDVWRT